MLIDSNIWSEFGQPSSVLLSNRLSLHAKGKQYSTVSSVHKYHIMKEVILHDKEACLLYTCRLALMATACRTDV
jgi:hypothetical protein